VTGLRPCGTDAAYDRHRNRGEVPCPDCCAAHADRRRAQYHRRRQVAA
jgi:hypothetical protein